MLTRVDRMLLAVRDREAAVERFAALLGAERVRDDESKPLRAQRTVVQAGESEFELLEPSGDGVVAERLERWGEGILAGGFASSDVDGLSRRLSDKGIRFEEEDGRLWIAADQTMGTNMVVSPEEERAPVGMVRYVYEVTNLVEDHERAAAFYADTFGLDASRFCPITSERYGYTGTLTLFNPPARLDRIEAIQTTDPSRPMGRFYARRGQSIYMCYVEVDDLEALRRRLEEKGARYSDPSENGLFIVPGSLCGMLMGVSRTNWAWTWSGRPELAKP